MSDYYNDLIGSDEERANLYKLMISKLGEYTSFFVFEYYDMDKVNQELNETLDSIINILMNYLDEEVYKDNYSNEIKTLIYNLFFINQPKEIKTTDTNELFFNHYLFYLKRKLDEIKSIIN
jgi:hypothetical protein